MLDSVMKFFTWLGYPQAYMIFIAIIYWSVNRKLGLRLALLLTLTASLNSLLKQAFHAPRPYWLDPELKTILPSNGFGMPSGHAQASTIWLYAASCIKSRLFWALAVVLVFMVGLSRVYLGVHSQGQVLIGWLIGIGFFVLFSYFEARILSWFLKLSMGKQLLLIMGNTFLMLFFGGMILLINRSWEMPLEWIQNSADDLAGRNESILSSVGLDAVAGNSGGFLGTALGALLLHRRGGFDAGGKVWKRIIRTLCGLVVLAAIYGVFSYFQVAGAEGLLYAVWRFSGFFLIAFSAVFLLPLLFRKLNLSN